jgi:hypothetical protein
MAVEVSMPITGKIIGYDPGGNDKHGVAALIVDSGRPVQLDFTTVHNAQAALDWFTIGEMPLAAGIDTLTVLCTGDGGWRPADRWLRRQYPQVQNSVVNPNYLQGSMALNGLAVMISLRGASKSVLVSETHPKVLYYYLSGLQYNYQINQFAMNAQLTQWIGLATDTVNDHEWDAILSCFAVMEGISGRWPTDLHQLPTLADEKLVQPGGASHYFWPLSPNQA